MATIVNFNENAISLEKSRWPSKGRRRNTNFIFAKIFDITGAYLECVLSDGDEVIMELDAVLVKILSELDPNVKAYTDSNGKVYVNSRKHYTDACRVANYGTIS
jgi:hypothetical protein